jgi:hypothetical protein
MTVLVAMTDVTEGVRTWLIDRNGFSKVGRITGRGDGVIGVLREWIKEVVDCSDEIEVSTVV